MLESFGARLRQRREQQGIDLATIAGQTKIKASLLESLERDDLTHWPSAIYRRAYVRAYAQVIGLDPDTAVRDFLAAHPEPQDDVVAAIASVADHRVGPITLRGMVGSVFKLRRSGGGEAKVLETSPVSLAQAVIAAPVDERLADVREDVRLKVDTTAAFEVPEVRLTPALTTAPEEKDEKAEPVACDFLFVAALCTEFARVERADQLKPLLGQCAVALGASGAIVWLWDPIADGLLPAIIHGYSERALAELPPVKRDDDNLTAAAFRTGEPCTVEGDGQNQGALVVPLVTPAGAAGVLALELSDAREQLTSVRAAATIFAALLAQLAGPPPATTSRHEPARMIG